MIDLHTHSTASDGTLSPHDLVRLAATSKLDALALTDHDTLAGLPEALAAGEEYGVEVIPGCELSVNHGKKSMHMLGLWTRPGSPALTHALDEVLAGRGERNAKMVQKLNDLGVDVTLAEVEAEAAGTVGRPHMAKLLKDKGYVKNFDHAFDEYVGNNGKAYVSRKRLSAKNAIKALKTDGALAIVAHPGLLRMNYADMEALLVELKDLGLDGLETYYTEHSARNMDLYLRMANKLGLMVTGGSDFHGAVKPRISLGRGKGSLFIPGRVLDDLKDYRKERGLWV